MEDKKNGKQQQPTLDDLRVTMQGVLPKSETIKVTGGKAHEIDKWNSGCGNITPQ